MKKTTTYYISTNHAQHAVEDTLAIRPKPADIEKSKDRLTHNRSRNGVRNFIASNKQ